MAKKQVSYVDTFFSIGDAMNWVRDKIDDNLDYGVVVDKVEIINISGGYRAGVIFVDNQLELFGSNEDA